MHNIGLKVIVLENFYTYSEVQEVGEDFVEDFFQDLELEIRAEVESKIGPISKIEFFKDHPDGLCKIRF